MSYFPAVELYCYKGLVGTVLLFHSNVGSGITHVSWRCDPGLLLQTGDVYKDMVQPVTTPVR